MHFYCISYTKAAAHLVISAALDYLTLSEKKLPLLHPSAGQLELPGSRSMTTEEVMVSGRGKARTKWHPLGWGTALWKSLWWSWGSVSSKEHQPWQQRTPAVSWAVLTGTQPVVPDKLLSPSTQCSSDHIWNAVYSFGSPVQDKLEWAQWRATKRVREGWSACPGGGCCGSTACWAWRREDFGWT